MIDENEPTLYHLTKNVIEKNKWFGFPKRNIVEAVLSLLLLLIILFVIPFTSIVRVMTLIIFGTTLVVVNVRGIRNRSVSQIMIAEYKFRKNKRVLHLRGPEWKRKKGGYNYASETADIEKIRKYIDHIKQRINAFIDENSKE